MVERGEGEDGRREGWGWWREGRVGMGEGGWGWEREGQMGMGEGGKGENGRRKIIIFQ